MKANYQYKTLGERFRTEWKIFLLAYIFVLIAELIGRKEFQFGSGMFILFPIFYTIILGVLSGPQVFKIINETETKAASKLVVMRICLFIAKLGVTLSKQDLYFFSMVSEVYYVSS